MDSVSFLSIEFLSPGRLWFLPVLLILVLAIATRSFGKLREFRATRLMDAYRFSANTPSVMRKTAEFILYGAIAAVGVLIVSRPEFIEKKPVPRFGGVRIAFGADMSPSSNVRDIAKGDTKISRAEAMNEVFFLMQDMLRNDPDIGGEYLQTVLPFAGDVATFGRFTFDADFVRTLGEYLTTDIVTKRGSDLSLLLSTYRELLERYPSGHATDRDILIVPSDGGFDPNVGVNFGALDLEIAATRKRSRVIAIGMGATTASEVPSLTPEEFRDEKASRYILDERGNAFKSGLAESIMRRIATDENGDVHYLRYTNAQDAVDLIKQEILKYRVSLPPRVEVSTTSAQPFFFGIVAILGTILLCVSRFDALRSLFLRLLRRRNAKQPMREVLFRETAD